jgi:hypothetical protein
LTDNQHDTPSLGFADILVQEQDHLIALATALGIDPPNPGIAD